jgi:hypothetical protein
MLRHKDATMTLNVAAAAAEMAASSRSETACRRTVWELPTPSSACPWALGARQGSAGADASGYRQGG